MKQRIELNYKGKTVNGIRITVSSQFPTNIDKVWNKIQDIETLRYIAKPKVKFNLIGVLPSQWKAGDIYHFKTWMHGFIPIGKHTIKVISIERDKGKIYTNEHNRIISIWNHLIIMQDINNSETDYTDIVDIYAGILTPFIAWWSIKYYKHRQKKWRSLSKNL